MTDTYRDKEGRECARLNTPPTLKYVWRGWYISHPGCWVAWTHHEVITAPTLAALRRKLVEEDGR